MSKKLIYVELDPSVWQRGAGHGSLLTHRGDGSRAQCCIGVACTAFGVNDDIIKEITTLQYISEMPPDEFENLFFGSNTTNMTDVLDHVYAANDDEEQISDSQRVKLINMHLEVRKARFRFKLKEGA